MKEDNFVESEFISIERTEDPHTVRLQFKLLGTSKNTFVYRVNSFKYWEKLTVKPSFVEYRGPEYLIHNEESNCIKGIEKPSQLVIDDTCNMANYTDPRLQLWKTIWESWDIERFNETCQEKRTLYYNYIYCFPYNITFSEGTFRMPPNVFRLDTNVPYEISGLPPYQPKIREINIIHDHDLQAIDSIHIGHFPMGSDVIDQTKWFEKMKDLHFMNNELVKNERSSIIIRYYSFAWWIIIMIIISVSILFLGLVHRMLNQGRSNIRSADCQDTTVRFKRNFESPNKLNQEINSREKSRIEVGRDESITINLNKTLPIKLSSSNYDKRDSL